MCSGTQFTLTEGSERSAWVSRRGEAGRCAREEKRITKREDEPDCTYKIYNSLDTLCFINVSAVAHGPLGLAAANSLTSIHGFTLCSFPPRQLRQCLGQHIHARLCHRPCAVDETH